MSQFPRSRFAPRRRNHSRTIFSARFRSFLALSLAALIFQAPFSFAASARAMSAQSGSSKAADSSNSALTGANDSQQADGAAEQTGYTNFFIVKLINGEATCLDATFAEAPISMPKDDTSGTLPDAGQKPVNPGYEYAHAQSIVVDNGNSITVGSGGLTINFNELSQLQSDSDRANVVAAFVKAAQVWTDRIKSPVTITINIDYGPLVPGCTVTPTEDCTFETNVIGSTGSASIQVDYPGMRANLLKSASSAGETNIYNALPATEVPSEVGNGLGIEVNRSTALALGYPTSSNVATIGFNKGFPFDFDPSDGISPTKMDFIAVATHEIGHALGFTSGVDESSAASMSTWDFYRFRPGTTAATFATAPRIMSIGGPSDNPTQVYFTGQSFVFGSNNTPTSELGLSTGGSNPTTTTNKGDGNQSSHWRDDHNISINYVGIMDPTISKGVHQEITDNDLSALDTIGWNLTGSAAGTGTGTLIPSAPPTPAAPANDNFASAQVITGCSGSLTSTNVGATRETGAGEPVNPDSSGSTKSVWYQWQAPSSGSVTISTAGSRFDTTLAVYSGSSVGALGTAVAHNDDAADDPNTVEREVSSSVTFNAVQGTTYRIAVNGYNNFGSGDIGRFILNWTAAGCATKTNQTISFSTTAFKAYGDAPFALSATASSNLPVSFSVVSGPVTLNGSTVTITGTGTAVIRASQTGDASYNAAPDVDQVLTISKGTPIITWNDPANIASGTALSSTQLNATANVAGSFAYSPVAGTVLDPGTHGLNVVFTPTDPNYNTATKSVLVNVIAPAGVTLSLNSQVGSVTESAGSLAIPVTRSGDASGAATVEYATTDNSGLTPCNQITGVASSRCDYATTIGTLRFAAGETSKNIFVPIVDDVWAEGTENFTLVLSKPTGATMGSNQVMVVSISDNDANSNGANPVDQNPFFVRQQYIDFLGREPDAAGLQGWQDVLNNCGVTIAQPCDKIEVSAGFFRSKEFQERGYFIYKFYSAIGRIPLYPEFMPDLAKVSGFLSDQQLEANKDAFVTEFMGRSEYQNKYGAITDPTAYVDALLSTVGLPTHPSRGGWIAGLQNNTLTRARVLRELTESSEMQLKYKTESFVIMQYFGYLRRSADASYLAWIDIMNQNPNNYRGMIDGFLNSNEYRKRFGQ